MRQLSFLALLIALLAQCTRAADPVPVVRMVIDYNDGSTRTFQVSWKKDMTVKDALDAAKALGHGFDYRSIGSGETAKLERIDDVQNQGGGANRKNWQFWINDKFADKSFGIYVLNADDRVLWKFDVFRETR
jgi:hypothetical protein